MVEQVRPYWPESLPTELRYLHGEQSLYDYLQEHANHRPDEIAYLFYGKEITWGMLLNQVNRLAGYFQQKGIKQGDCIALFMQNCPQYIISHYAILQLGGTVIPLNPMYKADELAYFLKEAPIKGIILSDDCYLELEKAGIPENFYFVITTSYQDYLPDTPALPICSELTLPKKRIEGADDFLAIILSSQPLEKQASIDLDKDIALMVFTSGTTGRPKGAQLTYKNALFKTAAVAQANGITQADRLMACAPLSHIAGMIMGVNIPIYAGVPCVLFLRFDPIATVQAIERYQITTWYSIAPMNAAVLQIPNIEERNLSSLKHNMATSFGLQVTEELATKWKAVTKGCILYEGAYGLSETHTCDTFMPKENIKYGSCGIPIYETHMKIIDPVNGAEMPVGQSGEIIVKNPGVFQGYLNRPEATSETLKDGWVYTGDIGYFDEDGYLYFQGRVKEMIKCSGYSVFPEDVEVLLNNHSAIQQSAVIGVPDPIRGETVKAFIVLQDSYKGKISEFDLISWSKEHMAAYKYPRYIEIIDRLPTTPSGKVLRKLLKEE
ncbi:AMP-binding protein [Cytobacillus sp. Hz8]|uniref:AMP-binding protein n=1 Tax=Cytobacillus sp. Hz8 TaxID=3347168 RepID=UPI0035DEAEF0